MVRPYARCYTHMCKDMVSALESLYRKLGALEDLNVENITIFCAAIRNTLMLGKLQH